MIALYHAIFLEPVFNAFVALYNLVGDAGIAIVLLTIAVRALIFPVTMQSIRSQKALQQLQPKLAALKEKHKGDRQALARATMELYKAEKVNPASSCLPLLVQLPIFLALYQALRIGLGNGGSEFLYGFVHNPGALDPRAFGIVDLNAKNYVLAALAGVSQYWQAAMLSRQKPPKKVEGAKDEAMMAMMNKQMLYVFPVMTAVIGASLPGGLVLYWLVTNLLTVLQQYVFLRPKQKPAAVNP